MIIYFCKIAVDYAWDNAAGRQVMCLTVYRNRTLQYDLTQPFGMCEPMIYENYNFIAFAATFDPGYVL